MCSVLLTTPTRSQCAWCGLILEGPDAGQIIPLQSGGEWSHGCCQSCSKRILASHARRRTLVQLRLSDDVPLFLTI